MKLSRRDLFYFACGGLAAYFAARWSPSIRAVLSPVPTQIPQVVPQHVNPFSRAGKVMVGVGHGGEVKQMVRGSVEMIGGLGRLEVAGKTVLVKPNVVTASPPPVTTNPEVVGSVVSLLKEAGAKRVIVGDSSAFIALPTKDNMKRTGIAEAAEGAGAEVAFLEDEEWVRVRPPGLKYIDEFRVSRLAVEADLYVSVPVVKTHRYATYSLALKNTLGIIHPANRPSLHASKFWEEIVAEINSAVRPHLIVIDGTKSMIAGGPLSGEEAETKMVIATGDLLAADLFGLALISSFGRWAQVTHRSIWDQRQVRRAIELGLGVDAPDKIDIRAHSYDGAGDFRERMQQVRTILERR